MKIRPTIICLTPVKNEAWILDRFLQCASLWADHIIIADQSSEDHSLSIAKKYPKVIPIKNESTGYSEIERQRQLIDAARKIPAPRLLIALDADECLSANVLTSSEWRTALSVDPGTQLKMQWVNLLPDTSRCWVPNVDRVFGFMDDGVSIHNGTKIHSQRLPDTPKGLVVSFKDIKVLHYQYTDWARMESKHRWYQMWEKVNNPNKHSIDIYRQYHHMNTAITLQYQSTKPEWLNAYSKHSIDMTSTLRPGTYWWDKEARVLLDKHQPKYFKTLDIWNISWSNYPPSHQPKIEPRSITDKLLHVWLRKTQFLFDPIFQQDQVSINMLWRKLVLMIDKTLKLFYF